MNKKIFTIAAVFCGVFAVSFAVIFIRFITAPPLAIAFFRLFFTTLILTPFFVFGGKKDIKHYKKYYLLSGFFLAFHFYFWITSLNYTSISSSVILVSLHPVFIVTFNYLILKEKIIKSVFAGIFLSILGVIIISVGEKTIEQNIFQNTLLGDSLALLGAVMMAGYLLIGRRLRQNVSTINYTFRVYGSASIMLLLLSLFTRTPLYPYPWQDFYLFLLLALVPTLMGHSIFNWALKRIPASLVSIIILGEPVGASFLAWLILNEQPSVFYYFGGLFILMGLFITLNKANLFSC